jgi:Predicted metal-sulfur cluster biosynthetic enzyme
LVRLGPNRLEKGCAVANGRLSDDDIRAALATVIDPELRRPLTELDMVDSVSADDEKVRAVIALTIVGCPASDRIERDVRDALTAIAGERQVDVQLTVVDAARRDD